MDKFSALKELQCLFIGISREKGFWDLRSDPGVDDILKSIRSNEGMVSELYMEQVLFEAEVAKKIALIASEAMEGLEGWRKGNPPDDKLTQFSSLEVELADVVIRALDLAGAMGYDLGEVIKAKCEYNKTREHKHGKRF